MTYFVTGGSGFIGAYVTRQLVAAGHQVVVYDLAPDRAFLADLLTQGQLQKVHVVTGDITDLPAILRAMKTAGAMHIIHLAALLGSRSNDNPMLSLKVNCEATLNIFEAALTLGIARVVWASSVGVFGIASKRPKGPVANDAPHQPTDLYGACKSLNERFSKHYRRAYGLDCIGLRYAAVYGYGKDRTLARGTGAGFMTELIDNPAKGLPGTIPAGDAIIDFVHVEDAARATLLACTAPAVKPVALNIGGFRVTLREAAEIVRQVTPDAALTVQDGSWNGVDHHYDLSAAATAIGYTPSISMEDGLRETIGQIRQRLAPA